MITTPPAISPPLISKLDEVTEASIELPVTFNVLSNVTADTTLNVPFTSNEYAGPDVPIPTFPVPTIYEFAFASK